MALSAHRKGYDWLERFKEGRVGVNESCGRPSTVTCDEVEMQVNQRIRDNRRISVYIIALEASVMHGHKRSQCGLRPSLNILIP
jgi:hypothetical protein